MLKSLLLSSMLLVASPLPSHAAGPFTCQAHGDTWSVVGSAAVRENCRFICMMQGQNRDAESGNCSAFVSPDMKTDVMCETMVEGKKWVGAILTMSQCSTAQ